MGSTGNFGSCNMSKKCGVCDKSVYPMDPQINLDGNLFHTTCAKCEDCRCQVGIPHILSHPFPDLSSRLLFQILRKVETPCCAKLIISNDSMNKAIIWVERTLRKKVLVEIQLLLHPLLRVQLQLHQLHHLQLHPRLHQKKLREERASKTG